MHLQTNASTGESTCYYVHLFSSVDEITLITAATTVAFIVVIGLMMKSMVALEEEKFKTQHGEKSKKSKIRLRNHDTR